MARPSLASEPKRWFTWRFIRRRTKSRASGVKYAGKFNFPRKIASIVFLRFSAVNGGYKFKRKKEMKKIISTYWMQFKILKLILSSFTHQSSKHVIHECTEWPPIDSFSMSATSQYFWRPKIKTNETNCQNEVPHWHIGCNNDVHVFDRSTKCMRNISFGNVLFAQTKIS